MNRCPQMRFPLKHRTCEEPSSLSRCIPQQGGLLQVLLMRGEAYLEQGSMCSHRDGVLLDVFMFQGRTCTHKKAHSWTSKHCHDIQVVMVGRDPLATVVFGTS